MDASQWNILQELLSLMETRQDPRNQAPGMGSTANALPHQNQLVDDRRYYSDIADNAGVQAAAGLGGAIGTLATAPPPFQLPVAAGLGAYGVGQGLRQIYGDHMARKLAYPGN